MYKAWNDWSVSEWLSCLEQRTTQEIQLGLTRVLEVAKKLKLHTPSCKVITVAGTNGKGSTVTALETLYHTAGYKVGSYTSPHLIRFNERIRLHLKPISDEELCKAFCAIEAIRGTTLLTYFEIATLAALWHFAQNNIDIIILEVGLGGRLDATNIVDADVAIITTIDYDHQEFLGSTLEAIAYEKAGILRSGKPFIYADEDPPASIIELAKNLAAPAYLYGKQYCFEQVAALWNISVLQESIKELPKPKIQLKSAAAALVACQILQAELPISYEQYRLAMNQIFIPARLQLVPGQVSIFYDVAHNAQSARLLAEAIKALHWQGRIHTVFSALKDKDILALVLPLKKHVDQWYPAVLNNKRAADAETLVTFFEKAEIFVEICYTSVLIAFEKALSQAMTGDLIVVYGSFFTVGQIMAFQHNLLDKKEIL